MSDAKVRGVVHVIEETKTFGQKGFRKRLLVLEQDNGRFPNYIPIDFTGDNCDSLDSVKVGDEVEVSYRLTGRKWQRDPSSEVKFFLNAEATGYKALGAKAGQASPADDNAAFLGLHDDTAYYFHYQPDAVTTLGHDFLATMRTRAGQYIIYADNCLLPAEFMTQHGIIFKKIPRDISRF